MRVLDSVALAGSCLVIATLLHAPAARGICAGDCDGDERVTVDELVRGVASALGGVPADGCAGFAGVSGGPTIDLLVVAVGNAVHGCPPPCTAQVLTVDDAAEGGIPDFRSLVVRDAGDEIHVDLIFHPPASRIGPGAFIRFDGATQELIALTADSFHVRSDDDDDGRFERVLYEGPLEQQLDDRLRIRLPAALLGNLHATRVSAFSIISDDHIPDHDALSLRCPTTPLASATPTVTPTPPPVAAWRAAFDDNRQKWLSHGIESYAYRYAVHCYCNVPYDVSITVFEDEIAEVRLASSGVPFDHTPYEFWYHTITGVFGLIEEAIDYPAARLEVAYHPQLGYPTHVFIDLDQRVADEEIGIEASEVTVVVAPTKTPTTPHSRPPTGTATCTATATPMPIVDNGDGTLLDSRTGLMWEKKVALDGVPNPDDPHDADNRFPWTGLCADLAPCQPSSVSSGIRCAAEAGPCAPEATVFSWLADLNARRFASYDDWRLPADNELHTLFDPAFFVAMPMHPPPPVQRGLHDPGCGGDCADLGDPACSCTAPAAYWTRTRTEGTFGAWTVSFAHPGGGSHAWPLDRHFHVRAVRGGTATSISRAAAGSSP